MYFFRLLVQISVILNNAFFSNVFSRDLFFVFCGPRFHGFRQASILLGMKGQQGQPFLPLRIDGLTVKNQNKKVKKINFQI